MIGEWLMVLGALLIAPWAIRQAKKDKESLDFFCRYAYDLETFYYPNHNLMRQKVLNIPEGWAEMVAEAIGETPSKTKMYVLNLWENGWSVAQIQKRLIERATDNKKQLFFVTNLEPHERS